MIICHCARITAEEVRTTAQILACGHPHAVLRPSAVYRALGKRPDCGGCMPLILKEMRRVSTQTAPDFSYPQMPCCAVQEMHLLCPRTGQACGEP